jgi:NTE family protein
MGHQVRSLRVRLLVSSFKTRARQGAYWSIGSDFERLPAVRKLPCSPEGIQELAAIPTDLGRMQPRIQERLINLGYAACDASLRSWFDSDLAPPTAFPYPASGV